MPPKTDPKTDRKTDRKATDTKSAAQQPADEKDKAASPTPAPGPGTMDATGTTGSAAETAKPDATFDRTGHEPAQETGKPDATNTTGSAARTAKNSEAAEDRIVARVAAPAGPRRRAGLSFNVMPRDVRQSELGSDPEAALQVLINDPMLSVAPPADAADD